MLLHPRKGRDATLILVRGRKSGRAALRVAAPRVMHLADRAEADFDDYSPEIHAVLRDGAALDWAAS